MNWIDLTSDALPDAMRQCGGLCLLPIGCLERHGPHLPVGTDTIIAEATAQRAAQVEPAIVFPSHYLGQIAEGRHCPGAVSLPHELLLRLLMGILDEIGRNGSSKVLFCNAHGGNEGMLDYLMRHFQREARDYVPYVCHLYQFTKEDAERWAQMRQAQRDGHGGEVETSLLLNLRPETVHLEDVKDPTEGRSRELQAALGRVENPWGWYAQHPTHFAGDPTFASAEKGQFLMEAYVRHLVDVMRRVKADDVTPRLQREFHEKVRRVGQNKG
jgi:creatinine amidohydrolase